MGSATAWSAETYQVTPSNMNGWSQFALNYDPSTGDPLPTTATNSFVTGPGTAPLGVGSFQTNTGIDGNSYSGVSTDRYDGVALTAITGLGYQTYTQQNNSGQAFYMVLGLSNGDALFFEPVYQNGAYEQADSNGNIMATPTYPNQCGSNANCVSLDTWQAWNTAEGGWWSDDGDGGAGSGGPPVITLADYAAQFPGVTIDGLYLQAGAGAPSWNNFIGNVDDFYISTNTGVNDVVDFDPSSAPAVPEPASLALVAGGLLLAAATGKLRKKSAAARQRIARSLPTL